MQHTQLIRLTPFRWHHVSIYLLYSETIYITTEHRHTIHLDSKLEHEHLLDYHAIEESGVECGHEFYEPDI